MLLIQCEGPQNLDGGEQEAEAFASASCSPPSSSFRPPALVTNTTTYTKSWALVLDTKKFSRYVTKTPFRWYKNHNNKMKQKPSNISREKINISMSIFQTIYNTILFLISSIMNKKTYYTKLPFLGAFYDFFVNVFMKFCNFFWIFCCTQFVIHTTKNNTNHKYKGENRRLRTNIKKTITQSYCKSKKYHIKNIRYK